MASLEIGIGLKAALFSAIEAVLLRRLPYPETDRIVAIDQTADIFGGKIGVWPGVFAEWQQRATSFQHLGAYDQDNFEAVLRDGRSRSGVTRMSSGLAVLAVPPLVGRPFLSEDDLPGAGVALLSHEFWMRRWNGARDVLSQDLLIDGVSYRVVGVMPAGFRFYHHPGTDRRLLSDVYLSDPWMFFPRSNRSMEGMVTIRRLRHGVTMECANSEVAVLASTTEYGCPPIADWTKAKL